jgi:uncharacterized DUF497 family protein
MTGEEILKILRNIEGFDWDKGNVQKNWQKHKVSSRECEEVFFNEPLILFKDEKHSKKEKRFGVLGITNKNRKLTAIFTLRDNKIRVISARNQSQKERRQYGKYEKQKA